MGKYVSIRGWLECDESNIEEIKQICEHYTQNYSGLKIDYNTRKLYQSGWFFPETQVNCTTYIFYGADIREYYLDFIREQIYKIAEIKELTGFFLLDNHEGEMKKCWQISHGNFVETEQVNILFNN